MYEELAWNNFIKTGDIESFLEYKKLMEINGFMIDDKGVQFNEANKNKGNSDKRNLL
ncbi:MAG: hypothetical protein Q4D02_03030 [Clostridia bacterium]|nr:hypothetical protein [Clostridia bacterium]